MAENNNIKVLCVEDEVDIRENIADILRDEGFQVFEAENGKKGYKQFLDNNPDIIISDIMMPESDGYDLLNLVRNTKDNRNNTVPFIFLTALGQRDDVIKGAQNLANDYLVKPIDFDLMIAKVKEKTSNRSAVKKVHEGDIDNIKDQISVILPHEVTKYIEVIAQTASALKGQPHGPLPSRNYLSDFEKIYMNAMRLRAVVTNSLDKDAISHRINANDKIIEINHFLENFVNGINKKLGNAIKFDVPFDAEHLPRVKINPVSFERVIRKILASLFRSDKSARVRMSLTTDHKDQLVLVIYYNSAIGVNVDEALKIDEKVISEMLQDQTCEFYVAEASKNENNAAIITIPTHRLIKTSLEE